ncbi:MAG: hypothetical protein H5T99_09800 [Moorella sp. (in: Bacteria)]|nr:hypothetical protein [Moorella sp. (in: firmicutes)]
MRNNRLENEILQRVDELIQYAISISLYDETSRIEQLARGISMVQEMGDLLLEVLEGQEQLLQSLLEQLVAQRLPDRRILQSFGNFPRDIQHIISEGISSYLNAREEKSRDQVARVETAPEAPPSTEGASGGNLPPTTGETGFKETISPVPSGAEEAPPPETAEQPLEKATVQPPPEVTPGDRPAPQLAAVTGEPVPDSVPAEIPEAGAPPPLEALRLALLQAYPEEEIIINYETRGAKIPFFLPRLQLGFELASARHDWRHDFYCRQQGISIRKVADDELANPAYLARRLRREAAWRRAQRIGY